MNDSYLLGVGGSGAKCVEAFVRLAMCGVGPESTWVGLMDQDRSNGNVGRTNQLLAEYLDLRRALRTPGVADLGGSPFLATELRQPVGGWAWTPEAKPASSLAGSIGYGGLSLPQQALAEALFSRTERTLELDEGFRQRPALGAAVTLQGLQSASGLWQELLNALRSAGHGRPIRVFLIASIFGGTGAGGFPTVARLLRDRIEQEGLEDRVKLGGALLLPYFSFPPPPDGGPAIRPDSAAFMMQARCALEYYARLQSEQVFDRLYVIGNDPLIRLDTYSDGGVNQTNPPMLTELVAALAAVDFAARDTFGNRGTVVVAGARADGPIGWTDLPFEAAGSPGDPRAKVAATLRAAVAWRQFYRDAFTPAGLAASSPEAWFRRLMGPDGKRAASSDATQRAVGLVSPALDALLAWFVSLNRSGAGGAQKLALLDDRAVAEGPPARPVLRPGISDAAFRALLLPTLGPSYAEVFARMTYGPVPQQGQGMGRVLAALRTACATDCDGGS